MNNSDRRRLDYLSRQPCIACGKQPVEIHHMCNEVQRKRDHKRTIPLCQDPFGKWGCHRGPFSIHNARKSWREKFGHEEDLLKLQNGRMS